MSKHFTYVSSNTINKDENNTPKYKRSNFVHVVYSDNTFRPVVIKSFTIVNIINAIIATHFYKEENWFSQAFNIVGIGKPGLWGVSVGIGMIGALMAIAAHRNETGYALAQISMLLTAFGGSFSKLSLPSVHMVLSFSPVICFTFLYGRSVNIKTLSIFACTICNFQLPFSPTTFPSFPVNANNHFSLYLSYNK